MKLLLFDIDGTLLLTGGAGRIAFERIFKELFDVSNAWNQLVPDGKTDPLIIEELAKTNLDRVLSDQEYQNVFDLYMQYFHEELPRSARFRVMPGIENLIPLLSKKQEMILGIATGNFEIPAWLKLERAGLRSHFHFGAFGSDASDRVVLTEMAAKRGKEFAGEQASSFDIYVIGDTVHDVRAGKAIGATTIAVATGKTSVDELKDARADWVFEDFSDPLRFLECLDSPSS